MPSRAATRVAILATLSLGAVTGCTEEFVVTPLYNHANTRIVIELSYELDSGDQLYTRARRGNWFGREDQRREATLSAAVRLDRVPVSNEQYAKFATATGREGPSIDEDAWRAQGYVQRYAEQVARFNWSGATPPIVQNAQNAQEAQSARR